MQTAAQGIAHGRPNRKEGQNLVFEALVGGGGSQIDIRVAVAYGAPYAGNEIAPEHHRVHHDVFLRNHAARHSRRPQHKQQMRKNQHIERVRQALQALPRLRLQSTQHSTMLIRRRKRSSEAMELSAIRASSLNNGSDCAPPLNESIGYFK